MQLVEQLCVDVETWQQDIMVLVHAAEAVNQPRSKTVGDMLDIAFGVKKPKL